MEVLWCESVDDFRYSLFYLLNGLITTASELRQSPNITGSKVWTIWTGKNCLDTHFGQIVCDKDGVGIKLPTKIDMPLNKETKLKDLVKKIVSY